jgi:hypothetical protein
LFLIPESLAKQPTEIDTLHLSIQEISKTLALHLPHLVHTPAPVVETPPAEHTPETVVETAPVIETPAAEPTPEPISIPSTPEVIEAPAETPTDLAIPEAEPEPSSPKTSLPRKRTSTLGYIGKIFWPFGSGSGSPKSTTPSPAQGEDIVSVSIAEATTVAA